MRLLILIKHHGAIVHPQKYLYLQRVVLDRGFFTISCREAVRRLPNGKNAHLIVKPHTWWKDKLELRFNILTYEYKDSSEQCQVFLEKK